MPVGFDPARRRFLGGSARAAPLHPPWAIVGTIDESCTRCGACISACPNGIIREGSGGLPEVDFSRGECSFCGACAAACSAPVFDLSLTPPWGLRASTTDACLALNGVTCQSCADACPSAAIRFSPAYRSAPRPRIDTDSCTGCGACVGACPADAIAISPQRAMERAVV